MYNRDMESPKRAVEDGGCGSASLIRGVLLLQEKWVFLIVHQLMSGPIGFCELSRKAHGVNPTTLSQRLDLLEDSGLLSKTVQSHMPPRTSYELTEAGRALEPVLAAIENWSENHLKDRATLQTCSEE